MTCAMWLLACKYFVLFSIWSHIKVSVRWCREC